MSNKLAFKTLYIIAENLRATHLKWKTEAKNATVNAGGSGGSDCCSGGSNVGGIGGALHSRWK